MTLTTQNEETLEEIRDAEELTWVLVGSTKTEHRSAGVTNTDGTYLTLCGKPVAALSDGDGKTKCKPCAEAETKMNKDPEAFWSPINGKDLHADTDTKEDNTVTETTTKPQADETEQAKADIENLIEQLGKLNKDEKDKILALEGQGNAELLRIKSANKRAPYSMRFKEAVAQAKERKPGAEIVLRAETKNVTEIQGYAEIVENAATIVAEGIKSQVNAHETARKVAEAILDGRLRVINKQGKPDLKGDRRQSKDLAKNIYAEAAKKLHADQWGADAAVDYQTLERQLKDKVQYQMTAVLPAFVYSLDNSPEQFEELFPAEAAALAQVKAEDPENETKPSDLVFELYGINRKSKAELAAERRAAAKAITSGGESEGEGSDEGEGEGSGDEGKDDKSPVLKLADTIGKTTEKLNKIKVDELSDEEAKALADQLAEFTKTTQTIALALAGRK